MPEMLACVSQNFRKCENFTRSKTMSVHLAKTSHRRFKGKKKMIKRKTLYGREKSLGVLRSARQVFNTIKPRQTKNICSLLGF